MSEKEIGDEYAQFVLESRKRGEISTPPEGVERRGFARVIVDSSDLWTDSVVHITVVDVSPTGVALASNHPIEIGKKLNISYDSGKPVTSEVVACEIDESPTEFLDPQYRVHCKFSSAKDGMRLVLETKKRK